jgi:hypothetical protein
VACGLSLTGGIPIPPPHTYKHYNFFILWNNIQMLESIWSVSLTSHLWKKWPNIG